MSSFLESPTPSRRWGESIVLQLWRLVVDHDRLATRKGVGIDLSWGLDETKGAVWVSEVKVILAYPSHTVLRTITRPDMDTPIRETLLREFKLVRNMIQLL